MDAPNTRPLTWTRVTPDHYNTDIKSPSPLIDVDKRPFRFMFLPMELRQQVYRIYLVDEYTPSPAEIHEMVLDSRHRTKSFPEILRVSKTVNAEVRDLLQHEKTITLRICWQDATLDGFAISCLQSRGMHLDYNNIAHLKVEIYPRHPDRSTDMVRIWTHVQQLCSKLHEASCVQKQSLHFMENEYAAWSIRGGPLDTFESLDFNQRHFMNWLGLPGTPFDGGSTDQERWDLLHVLNLFKLLKNVKKAQIHLPLSVTENVGLQEARKETEKVMMQTISLDDIHQKSVISKIEEAMAGNQNFLQYLDGCCAQGRLDRLCGEGCFMLKDDLDIFEKVWPHRHCNLWAYRLPSEYIGAKELEGEPLVDMNPWDISDSDFLELYGYPNTWQP